MEEIVNGIDVFREAFAPFADSFIVIGGSACRAVIPEGDIRPRKTTDNLLLLCLDSCQTLAGRIPIFAHN